MLPFLRTDAEKEFFFEEVDKIEKRIFRRLGFELMEYTCIGLSHPHSFVMFFICECFMPAAVAGGPSADKPAINGAASKESWGNLDEKEARVRWAPLLEKALGYFCSGSVLAMSA